MMIGRSSAWRSTWGGNKLNMECNHNTSSEITTQHGVESQHKKWIYNSTWSRITALHGMESQLYMEKDHTQTWSGNINHVSRTRLYLEWITSQCEVETQSYMERDRKSTCGNITTWNRKRQQGAGNKTNGMENPEHPKIKEHSKIISISTYWM